MIDRAPEKETPKTYSPTPHYEGCPPGWVLATRQTDDQPPVISCEPVAVPRRP
jgi:hypothetical protein